MQMGYYHASMELVSFKLPAGLRQRLVAEARRRRLPQAAIIREALESALMTGPQRRGEITCADLAGDLIGSVVGPPDLSTNKRYLEDAIVTDAKRGAKRRR